MIRSRHAWVLAASLLTLTARGDWPAGWDAPARDVSSVTGQFIVPPLDRPMPQRPPELFQANPDLMQLDVSLLAVSAEHFKSALWDKLGLPPGAPWNGKIFLALHPARALDEPVTIAATPFIKTWNYRLELPDLIRRPRYARAMSAVLLLELANRRTPVAARSAEVPDWLVDGLARQITETADARVALSAPLPGQPGASTNLLATRVDERRRGLDALAATRVILQNNPALTVEQMSWPNDRQLNGDDGGVYLACAQLFVNSLLESKNGPAKMRALLAQLPACRNWQTALFNAFHEDFRNPLALEKWWSLQVVAFVAHAAGPQWTLAVSRDKLNEALSVPVEIRTATNALPEHLRTSLQHAVRNFAPPKREEVLRAKLRDLDLIQLRLAPQLAGLAEGYREALADFLGERPDNPALRAAPNAIKATRRRTPNPAALIKRLDELDAQRRQLETRLIEKKTIQLPGQPAPLPSARP